MGVVAVTVAVVEVPKTPTPVWVTPGPPGDFLGELRSLGYGFSLSGVPTCTVLGTKARYSSLLSTSPLAAVLSGSESGMKFGEGGEDAWPFVRLVGLLWVIHPSEGVVVASIGERDVVSAKSARSRRSASRVYLAGNLPSSSSRLKCKAYCSSFSIASCSCCHLGFGLFPFGSKLRAIADVMDGSGSTGRDGSVP